VIERNLGNIERVGRFILGGVFVVWALLQPAMNGIEWFVTVISLSLILNGIFSRCYVWYLLDINTNKTRGNSTTIC
jgi:hypothetical protein